MCCALHVSSVSLLCVRHLELIWTASGNEMEEQFILKFVCSKLQCATVPAVAAWSCVRQPINGLY